MRTNITKTSLELFQSPKNTFYFKTILDDMYGFAPIGSICKRERYVGIYGVESIFWVLEQLHGSFGAHQDYQ